MLKNKTLSVPDEFTAPREQIVEVLRKSAGRFGNQERRRAPPRTRSTVASSGCSCRRPLFRLLPAPKVFAACQFSALLQKLNSPASDSVT